MPIENGTSVPQWWWCFLYPCHNVEKPITKAAPNKSISTNTLWTILTPKRGRLVINKGTTAQWMAQATDAAIPKASQLIRMFIKDDKSTYLQLCCKFCFEMTFASLHFVPLRFILSICRKSCGSILFFLCC